MKNLEDDNDDDNLCNFLKIIFFILFIVAIIKLEKSQAEIRQKKLDKINELIKRNNTIIERKKKELSDYRDFLNYKDRPKYKNDPLIKKEKRNILKKYSENVGHNLGSGINIFLDMKFNFGNQLLVLNKLIFYCEIIGCNKIILEKDNNIYIKNTIYDKIFNLTIEVSDRENKNNFFGNNFNFDDDKDFNEIDVDIVKKDNEEKQDYYYLTNLDDYFYYNNYSLRLENKFDIFKNEILKNLPKIKTNKNDLYIHIRGGDIFLNNDPQYAPDYAQPPLCFYQKIIKENKFRKIYIISADDKNPVINKLIKTHKNIIYKTNSLEKDIASLAFAYNIVGSISSFLISIIKLNNNLKYFWEYNRYPNSLGIPHMHHLLYNYTRSYTIFKMEPSETYKNEMIIWENSKSQRKIMLYDKCPNNFITVKPNIKLLTKI